MEMSWLESNMIEFGSVLEYEMGVSSYASSIHPNWARPTPFLPFYLCAPLHACCRLSTSANLDILGLVPSNPRHNTSLLSSEASRSGNKAEIRFLYISTSFPLYFRLRRLAGLKRKYTGNAFPLRERLFSMKAGFTLQAGFRK